MLKKFKVSNYRNFKKEIVFDFQNVGGYQFNTNCITNDIISKIIIYGRNATGKTNLGRAIMDIAYGFPYIWPDQSTTYLNADSDLEVANFSYLFQFDNDEFLYEYAKSSKFTFKSEKLYLNGNLVFNCDYDDLINSEYNFSLIAAETVQIERFSEVIARNEDSINDYVPYPSLLRWLSANVVFDSESPIMKLFSYITRMVMLSASSVAPRYPKDYANKFYEYLEKDSAKGLENFLNKMGVACELVLKKLPDNEYKLYFYHNKLVPFFENASSGTIALVNLYRRLMLSINTVSLFFMDEFDAFYHYEMSERVVRYFKEEYPECQVILTTHNTNLMSNNIMRPDCLFIISSNGDLTALNKATLRELREGHNLEKMYINGEFVDYE